MLGERAIVREEEQAFACVIESPDRVQAFGLLTEEFHDRRPAFRVVSGRDIAFWFVQKKVDEFLPNPQGGPIHTDGVVSRVGFRAQFGHDFAVDANATRRDEFFGLTTRGDSSGRENLLQALGHKSARAEFRWFRGPAQCVDFLFLQESVPATRNTLQVEWTKADTMNLFDGMMLAEKYAAQGFQFRPLEADFVPVVCGVAADRVGLTECFDLRACFLAETIEFRECQHAFHFELVHLVEMVPVFQQARGEVTVIRQEHEPSRSVFKIPDGIDALRESAQEIAKCLAAFGIGERRDDFRRLMQNEVDVAFGGGINRAASGFDFVDGWIGFGPEFAYGFAIDADLPGEDQLLGVSARSDASARNNFLQSFEHEGMDKDSREEERKVEN